MAKSELPPASKDSRETFRFSLHCGRCRNPAGCRLGRPRVCPICMVQRKRRKAVFGHASSAVDTCQPHPETAVGKRSTIRERRNIRAGSGRACDRDKATDDDCREKRGLPQASCGTGRKRKESGGASQGRRRKSKKLSARARISKCTGLRRAHCPHRSKRRTFFSDGRSTCTGNAGRKSRAATMQMRLNIAGGRKTH